MRRKYPASSHKYILSEIPVFSKPNTSGCNRDRVSLVVSAHLPIPRGCHQLGPPRQTGSAHSRSYFSLQPHQVIALQPHLHGNSQKRQVQPECSKCYSLSSSSFQFLPLQQNMTKLYILVPIIATFTFAYTFGPLQGCKVSLLISPSSAVPWGQKSFPR